MVWGTDECAEVAWMVWGTDECAEVAWMVWGTDECAEVAWMVWGTDECAEVAWMVWGTDEYLWHSRSVGRAMTCETDSCAAVWLLSVRLRSAVQCYGCETKCSWPIGDIISIFT
jgi:hypothetical protein